MLFPQFIGALYAIPISLVIIFRSVFSLGRCFRTSVASPDLPILRPDPSIGTSLKVALSGNRIVHAVECGDKRKPLMLLLHGFPETWYCWRHVMQHYASRFHVVAIDLPGFGQSYKPKDVSEYAIYPHMTGMVADFVSALGHDHVDVMLGHDWGGLVCWNTAHVHPDLVRKLIVLNAPHPLLFKRNMSIKQFFKSWYMFLFQVPYVPELLLKMDNYAFFTKMYHTVPQSLLSKHDLQVFTASFALAMSDDAAPLKWYRVMFRKSQADAAYKKAIRAPIRIPTLVLWGDNDTALDASLMNGLDSVCSNCVVQPIRGASHWVQQERPTEVCSHIDAFLHTLS